METNSPNQRPVVPVGPPCFAHSCATRLKMALLGANKHHYAGLMNATQLPTGPCVRPLSPNDHPASALELWGSLVLRLKGIIPDLRRALRYAGVAPMHRTPELEGAGLNSHLGTALALAP